MKKQVSASQFEFEIEIEKESAHLQHFSHLTKEQADKAARENINNLFEIT